MTKLSRLFGTLVIVALSLTARLEAFTVQQMKEMEGKVKELVARNMPAVVSLIGHRTSGAGSGVVVSADGLILTAAHVTRGNEEMIVVFPDGRETKCKVLGANYERDIGLAKITTPGSYPFATMGDSDKLATTTIVVGLGHPGGYNVRRTPPVRIGRISMTNMGGFLVSDCTLISGDSGGPLFDLDGKVVGIHSSISESLSFNRDAPVSAAKNDWDKLLAGKRWGKMQGMEAEARGSRRTGKAVLGAVVEKESADGAVITEVQPQSPLEKAGLKVGDVILRLGGDEIKTGDALVAKVAKCRPGDKLDVVYRRDGMENKVEVTLISQAEMLKRMNVPPGPQEQKTPAK
ncbi:MAG: trypsin-like peptidase domain-containing protein [Chthoniobacteraceae bacterium]